MCATETPRLPPNWPEQWKAALSRIAQAGYGEVVTAAYRANGPEIAKLAGPESALQLGRLVSEAAIRCDRRSAALICEVTLSAIRYLSGPQDVGKWLKIVEVAVKAMPKHVGHFLDNSERLLKDFGLDGLQSFVRMAIAIGHKSTLRQAAFLRLQDPEARRFLTNTGDLHGFHAFEERLKPFLTAIWGISPPIRESPAGGDEPLRRRAGFGNGGIVLPPSYSGFHADQALQLYRASLAHVGAHHRHTRSRFPVNQLKPLHIAVISLIEDARIERLAIRDMAGLAKLWRPFHVAQPSGMPVAVSLLARLSRALIDPEYVDTDGWVEKGKSLFEHAALDNLNDQSLSRRIGGLLANDLGQMRLQFDAKSYAVQPAYRDDNSGIWDHDDQLSDEAIIEEMITGARIEQQQSDTGKPDENDAKSDPEQRSSLAAISSTEDNVTTIARYDEYDYVVGRNRPEWCTLRELEAVPGHSTAIKAFEERHADIADRLSMLIRSAKIGRAERIKRQAEGDVLDIDACIEGSISQRLGVMPDFRVYGRTERRTRDLSVLLLLDISQSTSACVKGRGETVLDLERFSTALLAKALSDAGDPFAIAAFCSDTREDVRYFRIKDFSEPYNTAARSRLAGLRSGLSTRLGTAIRHAGTDLARCRSHRRLLLLVTDGEPSDVDVDDSRYLVEDARSAVHAINRDGIDTFCVALSSGSNSYADSIFGRRATAVIASIDQLPIQLPTLFYRLTR